MNYIDIEQQQDRDIIRLIECYIIHQQLPHIPIQAVIFCLDYLRNGEYLTVEEAALQCHKLYKSGLLIVNKLREAVDYAKTKFVFK